MNILVTVLIILSLLIPLPAHAAVIKDFDPIEKDLLSQPDAKPIEQENQRLNEDFQKQMKQPEAPAPVAEQSGGSNWWKWTLGILVVGGIAAVAGGGGGGSGGGGSEPSTVSGTMSTGW